MMLAFAQFACPERAWTLNTCLRIPLLSPQDKRGSSGRFGFGLAGMFDGALGLDVGAYGVEGGTADLPTK